MGDNHVLECLDCETKEMIDLETDGEKLKRWLIKHWGHGAQITFWEFPKNLPAEGDWEAVEKTVVL